MLTALPKATYSTVRKIASPTDCACANPGGISIAVSASIHSTGTRRKIVAQIMTADAKSIRFWIARWTSVADLDIGIRAPLAPVVNPVEDGASAPR